MIDATSTTGGAGETPEPTILKLGGSVITDKSTRETVDEASLRRAADAIAAHLRTDGMSITGTRDDPRRLVLVHGAGSFGHYYASEHGVTTTEGTDDAAATLSIHDAMKRLNTRVLERFHEREVPALPVHPLSAGTRNARGAFEFAVEAVETMLEAGFVPVLHGDVVAQAGAGATIVSGDEVLAVLGARLGADRVGLCSAVPGVLDANGAVIERIDSSDAVADLLGGSEATDVTGGMTRKVETLLALDVPASIFGLDGLEAFLAGDSPGTRVE